MTSNLGSDVIQELSGNENYEQMKSAVMDIVASRFRPEFINRIDDAIVFHLLAQEHIRAITEIQLQQLQARLQDREIILNFSDTALSKLSEAGFDPVYGARPLKRAIQELVENPLAQALLSGEIQLGQTVQVDLLGEKLSFNRKDSMAA